MSTNALAGLSLDAIIGTPQKPAEDQAEAQHQPPRQPVQRTLIDIIKEEEPSKERRSWEHFRKTLLLKRASEAWSSSAVPHEESTAVTHHPTSRSSRSNSAVVETMPLSDPYFKRGKSGRNKMMEVDQEDHDGSEIRKSTDSGSMRLMSAREAVAAQQAADSGKAEAVKTTMSEEEEEEKEEEDGKNQQSLFDFLGDYGVKEEEEEEDDEDDDEAEAEADGGGIEHNCCMCMVRHKGAAFIPCGHTFCRICSRELMVQRGNCPICNNFILEVLEIF